MKGNSDGKGKRSSLAAPSGDTLISKGVTNCAEITENPSQCGMGEAGPNEKPMGIDKHSVSPSDRPSSFRFR